jgi:hypothetical protein
MTACIVKVDPANMFGERMEPRSGCQSFQHGPAEKITLPAVTGWLQELAKNNL